MARTMGHQNTMNDRNDPAVAFFGGNPGEIARGLREYSKSAEILSEDQPWLINEYPMKWVGVYQGKVSAKADDLPSLMRKLKKQGVAPGDAIIRFIERNQRTLILSHVAEKVRGRIRQTL